MDQSDLSKILFTLDYLRRHHVCVCINVWNDEYIKHINQFSYKAYLTRKSYCLFRIGIVIFDRIFSITTCKTFYKLLDQLDLSQ